MAWQRFAWFGGGVAVAVGAGLGCSSADEAPVLTPLDGSPERTADGGALNGSQTDAVRDDAREADSGVMPPGVCGLETGPTTTNCGFADAFCTSDHCPTTVGAVAYSCLKADGGDRPPVEACALTGRNASGAGWCCPPACVPADGRGITCEGDRHPWLCPTHASSGTLLASPPFGCTLAQRGYPRSEAYCCP